MPLAPVPIQLSRQTTLNDDLLPNVHGKELFTSGDFWLLCSILTIRMSHFSDLPYLPTYPLCHTK
jgi:hypothetical protein